MLVTGAAGGLGSATCELLRRDGARVLGTDVVAGPDDIAADVRDTAAVQAAVAEAVRRLGGLDVLVNAAGVGFVQDSGQPPGDGALAVLDVNLLGTWRATAAALPALLDSHGRVVMVASVLSRMSVPFAAAYCASKRAVTGYADVLRLEYGTRLSVSVVHPGYVRTPIHADARSQGVSLDGLFPPDEVSATARAIAGAATGGLRRDVTTNWRGAAMLALARHAPALVDHLSMRRVRSVAAEGRWDGLPLTQGLLERLRDR